MDRDEEREVARKVVKSGFDAILDKSHIADKIIELDDSYDHLELMKHANYTIDELKELKKDLEDEDSET